MDGGSLQETRLMRYPAASKACPTCGRAFSPSRLERHQRTCVPIVKYYYRGCFDGRVVYSRKNEQPYMTRRLCQLDAIRERKRAVFLHEETD